MQHHFPALHLRRTGRIVLVSLVAMLCVLSGSTATGAAAPGSLVRASEDPLLVRLSSISPSTLTNDNRPLTITGTLTNNSADQWSAIKLYALRSEAPIVDSVSLAASAQFDANEFVGDRIVEPGTEDTVDLLEPGQTVEFSLTVPRADLAVTAAGVYWLGVQALGTSTSPRDILADGRARTFIPLVPRARGNDPDTIDTAIVVPIRENVWTTPDGRIARLERWARTLGVGGRLRTMLDVAGESGTTTSDVSLTWLVDPAVLAAVARLAANNPARSLAPDPSVTPVEPTEGAEGEVDAEGGTGPGRPDPFTTFAVPIPLADPDAVPTEEESRVAGLATAWLERFTEATSGSSVLALPFGDIDASAAASLGPDYYRWAVARSTQVMSWLGIVSAPALAPRDGKLSPEAISAATADTTILLSDTSFAVRPDAPQSVVRLLDHKVVLTSDGASSGGPSPTAADDPLALRQRLLSEAALRLQSGSRSPIVMMLPADWQPSDPSALLDGLDVSWLDPVSVADVSPGSAVALSGSAVDYTAEDRAAELDTLNFSAADQLSDRADLLASVLSLPNLLRPQVGDEVLMSLSAGHRVNTAKAADSARAASNYLAGQLGQITIDAPGKVTLSSASGNFGSELVNGLDQPVTVEVAALSDDDLTMENLGSIQISAGSRHRILPSVTAERPGVHQVSLIVTGPNGTPLGRSDSLQIRAAEVSGLIWLFIAVGAMLLFGTIAIRLVRRIRARTRSAA